MPLGEECSAWERWLLQYGEWLSTGILVAVPSVLSPEPPAPDSSQVSLVHTALPLPNFKVRGCKQNFVCWSFKSLLASLAISSWQMETLLLFTAGCYLGFFRLRRLESPPWGLDPTLLRGKPPSCWNIPLELQLLPLGTSVLPTSLAVVKWFLLSVLGYKASLQQGFSWLFWMISLWFCCNSILIRGRA